MQIPASDDELLDRAKRHSTGFTEVLGDPDIAPFTQLYACCVRLVQEQRGYRNISQIERIALHLQPDVDNVDEIVREAIDRVDDFYPKSDYLFKKLLALPPNERRRTIRKRGLDWPTREDIQERIETSTFDSMANEGTVVIVSPTASGKTEIAVTTKWTNHKDITGGEPVILFTETKEARDEAVKRAEDSGLDVAVLLGRKDACPVAAGDYDDEILIDGISASDWFDWMIEEKGRSTSEVHREAETEVDGDLPCCIDAECTLKTQWDGVPRDENENTTHDLVIATDAFAKVPLLRSDTNIIHDEQPNYSVEFNKSLSEQMNRIRQIASAYLEAVDAPVTTWEEYVFVARNEPVSDRAEEILRAIQREDPVEGWLYKDGAHSLAPRLLSVIWKALSSEPNQNGRLSATIEYNEEPQYRIEGNEIENSYRLSVVLDENHTVRSIRHTPDFSTSRAVIGLDAWPCLPLWERNVSSNVSVDHVLTRSERRFWRFFERGLSVIQVGNATRPDSKGSRFNAKHAQILLEHLNDLFPSSFRTAGTPKAVKDDIRSLMGDVGIKDPKLMHLGEQKSRNDFGGEVVGLLYATLDPGDDYILDLLAECELDARPEYRGYDTPCDNCNESGGCKRCLCESCNGEGCTDCHQTGHKREFGRKFVGPDSENATEFLESVRAFGNAQMLGRWGRDNEIDSAVVYTATSAVPEQLVDVQVPGVQWKYTDKQAAVVEQLEEKEQVTTREIRDAIEGGESGKSAGIDSISRQAVWKTLSGGANNLVDYGKVAKKDGAGDHGADLYEWRNSGTFSLAGIADLGPRIPVNE